MKTMIRFVLFVLFILVLIGHRFALYDYFDGVLVLFTWPVSLLEPFFDELFLKETSFFMVNEDDVLMMSFGATFLIYLIFLLVLTLMMPASKRK